MELSTTTPSPIEDFPVDIQADRYVLRLAQTQKEIESALQLRYEVFNVELGGEQPVESTDGLEYDEFDFNCKHLIVVEKATQKTVGTYRLNSIETAGKVQGFYSFSEFSIEDLPSEILMEAVEIGRACIAVEHRNTKVLFLLWKGLAAYIKGSKKRFLFGCCSIFTTDRAVGLRAYRQLERGKYLHDNFRVKPRTDKVCYLGDITESSEAVELPGLFDMYLRIGAKVCGEPTVDLAFGTIDFFVLFDERTLNDKYRRMFFGKTEGLEALPSPAL